MVPRIVPRDTGFPRADVENDFLRARRRQVLSRLAAKLHLAPGDVNMLVRFNEVSGALGVIGQRDLGVRTIKLSWIVGSVESGRGFDGRFRPTSNLVRGRWERLALAQRRGESFPPIDVYRIGDMHFVKDGHHRVSIAMATGQETIEAHVVEIKTAVSAAGIRGRSDLVTRRHERPTRSAQLH